MMPCSARFRKGIFPPLFTAPLLAAALALLWGCGPTGTPQEEFGWRPGGEVAQQQFAPPAPTPPAPPPPPSQTEAAAAEDPLQATPLQTQVAAIETPPAYPLEPDFSDDTGSIILEVSEGSLADVPPPALEPTSGDDALAVGSDAFALPDAPLPPGVASATDTEAETAAAPPPPPVPVALLLPLSAARPEVRRIATDMNKAATMALFDMSRPEVVLLPIDTGGTAYGARRAMTEAIDAGAALILGPLLAGSVRATAPLAAEHNLTMIAFSNDATVLDDHILLLNFSPEQDVRRIISFARERGITDYAALLPNNAYGERARAILERHLRAAGGRLHAIERYERVIDGPYEPARRLAELGGPGAPPFDAVLLADDGEMLRIAAAALAYFDLSPPQVQLLGTHRWDAPESFAEPALLHGWYPMQRSEGYEIFLRRYEELHGGAPESLAALAYDSVSLVGLLMREGGDWQNGIIPPPMLLRAGGFTGVQGVFRFRPDGGSERTLAIWQVGEDGAELLDPAPYQFLPSPDAATQEGAAAVPRTDG